MEIYFITLFFFYKVFFVCFVFLLKVSHFVGNSLYFAAFLCTAPAANYSLELHFP